MTASSLPKRATARATAASQSAVSDRSAGHSSSRAGSPGRARPSASCDRSTATTSRPSASSSRAQARPMPLAAPVTITVSGIAPLRSGAAMSLRRGEARRLQDRVAERMDERAVFLAFGARGDPFGIGLERGEALGAVVERIPFQHVDEVLIRFADLHRPIADLVEAMLLEEVDGDLLEARYERLQLARHAVIGAKLIDHRSLRLVCDCQMIGAAPAQVNFFSPSPLEGEGRGEGSRRTNHRRLCMPLPLTLTLSLKGRGYFRSVLCSPCRMR